jgi:hypothetical protein
VTRFRLFLAIFGAVTAFTLLSSMSRASAASTSTPGAPQHVSTVVGTTQVRVTWTKAAASKRYPVTRYVVTGKPAMRTCIVRATVRRNYECTFTGLRSAIKYVFGVRAFNKVGAGRIVTLSVAIAPSTPTTTTTTTTITTAPPPAPTASLSISTNSVPSTGGPVSLNFSSQNATSCTLASSPALWSGSNPAIVNCNGSYQANISQSTTQQQWTFTFTATNADGQSATAMQTLTELAPVAPAAYTSTNWSGYVVPSSSALITDAQGEFTVPTLNCASTPNADDAVWIGIGGEAWATGGNSGSLLQTGINANCVNGVQVDSGWWEVVPATPNHEQMFGSFPVKPGDVIEAYVYQTTSGAWATRLDNLSTGLTAIMVTGESWGVGPTTSGNITWNVQGSAANISYAGGYTAEWIVEDVTDASSGTLFPFANFGSVTFSNLESSFTTWSLTSSETWAIVQSGVTLATPTSTSTDGFTVSYTGP